MTLKFWHNNAYDTITLQDDNDHVVGSWTVDAKAMLDFVETRVGDVSDWDANGETWRPTDGVDQLLATMSPGNDGSVLQQHSHQFAQRVAFYQIDSPLAQ